MTENYAIFRECLSNAIVARSEKPKTKRKKGKRNERPITEAPERADPEELAEFVDVHLSTTAGNPKAPTNPKPKANKSSSSPQKHSPPSQNPSKP
jgi:hypothetical protein